MLSLNHFAISIGIHEEDAEYEKKRPCTKDHKLAHLGRLFAAAVSFFCCRHRCRRRCTRGAASLCDGDGERRPARADRPPRRRRRLREPLRGVQRPGARRHPQQRLPLLEYAARRIHRGKPESWRRPRTHHRERGDERPALKAARIPRSGGHESRRHHRKPERDLRRWRRLFECLPRHPRRRARPARPVRRLCGASHRGRQDRHPWQGA